MRLFNNAARHKIKTMYAKIYFDEFSQRKVEISFKPKREFKKVRSIGCVGRRWWDKQNTYHSAYLVVDGVMIQVARFSYGYGDSYVQSCEQFLNIPAEQSGHVPSLWRYCSANGIVFFQTVADVSAKKDL